MTPAIQIDFNVQIPAMWRHGFYIAFKVDALLNSTIVLIMDYGLVEFCNQLIAKIFDRSNGG